MICSRSIWSLPKPTFSAIHMLLLFQSYMYSGFTITIVMKVIINTHEIWCWQYNTVPLQFTSLWAGLFSQNVGVASCVLLYHHCQYSDSRGSKTSTTLATQAGTPPSRSMNPQSTMSCRLVPHPGLSFRDQRWLPPWECQLGRSGRNRCRHSRSRPSRMVERGGRLKLVSTTEHLCG